MSTIISILCLILIGCGGGTSGTGGITVSGRVASTTNEPVTDAAVTVVETGQSTNTNSSGTFSLFASTQSNFNLLVETDDISSALPVTGIDSDVSSVEIDVSVDKENRTASTKKVEVKKKTSKDPMIDDSKKGSNDDSSNGSNKDDDKDNKKDDKGGNKDKGNNGSSSDDQDDDDNSNHSPGNNNSENNGNGNSCTKKDAEGIIAAISQTSITVSGITFVITSQTESRDEQESSALQSQFSVGDEVKVKGECNNSQLTAKRIEKEDE